ncbi:MAG: thioredoxin family protein [Desulfovibrionaceae bacterium]|nr:thioredoxin family protein [Desulfovibrionaceae bacterium]
MRLNKLFFHLFFALVLIALTPPAQAQIQPSSLPLRTAVQAFAVPAGILGDDDPQAVVLTVTLNMEEDWYTYSNVTGELGKPTTLTAKATDGTQLPVFYPEGEEKPDPFDSDAKVMAYKSGTRLFVLMPGGSAGQFPVSLHLDLLLCHPTKCVPARLNLPSSDAADPSALPAANAQPWWKEFHALWEAHHADAVQARPDAPQNEAAAAIVKWHFTPTYLQPGLEVGSLVSAVLMGLLAGLILNIMPCVLPVVSLKLSALLGAAEGRDEKERYRAFREHNIYFVLGLLAFFLVLAAVLGATGKAWGALFQYRWLVLAMAGIMATLGLSLFGLFHLPVIDLKFGSSHITPRRQAFFTGMLTTLLATPCSGPFLGGVLGWALLQGGLVIATVFSAIGVGMAAPYLLLVLNPKLARFLPKSGPWIEFVEKGIGFFLLGTAFYLVSIAYGTESLRVLAPLWVVLAGAWLWKRTNTSGTAARWTVRLASLALLAASIAWTTPSGMQADPWEPFDPVTLNESLGRDVLFVDFTADWCPTCKALEATVMTDENVNRWKARYPVRFIKVDMTERDPEAEALLQALGSRSIPTAAVFRTDEPGKPLVLRDLFTTGQVEKILKSL